MTCNIELSSEKLDQPSPILELPPELFLHIVSILVFDWPPNAPRWTLDKTTHDVVRVPLSPGKLGWMSVTHVCRHWRELCIGTQSFWTHWIGRLPQALPAIVSRAGNNTNLHVDVELDEVDGITQNADRHERFWHLLPQMSRIRTMSWKTQTCEDADKIADRLCAVSADDTPISLESLSIHVSIPIYGLSRRPREGSLHTPVLRTLSLGQTSVETIHAPFLTVLNLQRPKQILFPKTLYNLLVGCPMLMNLSIVEGHFSFSTTKFWTQDALSLNHLNYLQLDRPVPLRITDTDYTRIYMLFTCVLRMPPTATIEVAIASPNLQVRPLSVEDIATSTLVFCVESVMQADPPNTLRFSTHAVVLAIGTSVISAPYTEWRTHTLPNARKRARIDHELDTATFISCLISPESGRFTSCLRGITVLSLDPRWPGDDEYRHVTYRLLQALPSLRTIRIASNSSWREFLEPLGVPTSDTGGVLLPELQYLWLDGASPSEKDIGDFKSAFERAQLYALTYTLVARARLLSAAGIGRSPRTIFLHDFSSTIPPNDPCVQLLRSEVEDVVFVPSDLYDSRS
ncbi:hypothetical protein PENSPDRAFT_652662 [Peniophora sp. CONT]|nr:hypothetical protein PENSPDRAFT_652662 [Peniophora sp. CONT]